MVLTLAEESLLVQYSDGVGAEDGCLDKGVEGERHAGNFFFFCAFSPTTASGQGEVPEVVTYVVLRDIYASPPLSIPVSLLPPV